MFAGGGGGGRGYFWGRLCLSREREGREGGGGGYGMELVNGIKEMIILEKRFENSFLPKFRVFICVRFLSWDPFPRRCPLGFPLPLAPPSLPHASFITHSPARRPPSPLPPTLSIRRLRRAILCEKENGGNSVPSQRTFCHFFLSCFYFR